MKDIISKVTFGFLMAQLVPGAIVVYSSALLYLAFSRPASHRLMETATRAIDLWTESVPLVVLLAALATAAGMAIHGLHWAVLGHLESRYADRDDGSILQLQPVYETFWHQHRIFLQILLGPVKLLLEVLGLLFIANGIREVAIEENVTDIPPERIEAFRFLQEFYLHFAQFYAHTSYALLYSFIVSLVAVAGPGLALNAHWLAALGALWLSCGFFFVIGRIQFASLFRAETALRTSPRTERE